MVDSDLFMRLTRQMLALPLSDLSVFDDALKPSASSIMTIEGSAKHKLCLELELIGWLASEFIDESASFSASQKTQGKLLAFSPTEIGRSEISKLNAFVQNTRSAMNKLTVIRNPTVGFIGLDAFDKQNMGEDARVIGPLFKRHSIGPSYPTPCHVLFLYGKVDKSGVIHASSGNSAHVRDVAKKFRASLVVLASDNVSEVFLRGYPWKEKNDWRTTVIFISNRNGARFAEFFRDVFALMFEGKSFGFAYVQKAPQTPHPDPNLPGSLFAHEFPIHFKNEEGGKPWDDYMTYASFTFNKDIHIKQARAAQLLQNIQVLDEDSKHPETLFSRLGAFCGISAQLAIHPATQNGGVKIGPEDKNAVLIVTRKNNDSYVYGEFINQPIFYTPISVSGMMTYALQATEGVTMSFEPLIRNVNATLEIEGYGTIKSILPEEHLSRERPLETLKNFVPRIVLPLFNTPEPMHIAWIFALAAQKLILEKSTILRPQIAAQIFLEAAFLTSKLAAVTVKAKSAEMPSSR